MPALDVWRFGCGGGLLFVSLSYGGVIVGSGAVIFLAFLRIAKDFIGNIEFSYFSFCIGIFLIEIRMIFFDLSAVGPFNFFV